MPLTKRNDHGLTMKEEKFCLRYMSHGIQWRAYAESYNAGKKREPWLRKEAYRLMMKPQIQARIRQLHEQLEQSAIYDHRQCMLEAHEAYLMAAESGDARGMVAAAMLKAKVSGLIVEKSLSVQASIGTMSEEEIGGEYERINEQLRAAGHPPLPARAVPRLGAPGPRVIAGQFEEVSRERVASG